MVFVFKNVVSALLLSAVFFLLPLLTLAQEEVGLSISPAVIEATLDPGASNQYSITLKNLSNAEQVYFIFARNIASVGPGGVPIFASSDLEKTGFEISEWITLPTNQLTIGSQESAVLNFELNVPEDASPGSHAGGLFFSVDPPEMESSGAAVGYQVANIISIRVDGDVDESANIRQFSTSKFLYGSQNVDFIARIENTGNVSVRPTGPIEIFNMLGNKVGTVTFNEERAVVFRASDQGPFERTFENINWTGDSVGFGRYEAIVSLVYGEEGAIRTMSSTASFWILPMNIIGPALAALAVLLLIVFIVVKLYIKRSLAHLNQGRRVVNRRRKSGTSSLLLLTVVMLTVTAVFLIALLALFA